MGDDDTPEIEVHMPDAIRSSLRRAAAMELSAEKMLDRAALLAIGLGQDLEQFLDTARQSFNLNLMDAVQRAKSKEKEWREARKEVLAKKQDDAKPESDDKPS